MKAPKLPPFHCVYSKINVQKLQLLEVNLHREADPGPLTALLGNPTLSIKNTDGFILGPSNYFNGSSPHKNNKKGKGGYLPEPCNHAETFFNQNWAGV